MNKKLTIGLFLAGERQYKAQWWGMPAAFSKSELLAWHVEKDDPREIRYVRLLCAKKAWTRLDANSVSYLSGSEAALRSQRTGNSKGNVGEW